MLWCVDDDENERYSLGGISVNSNQPSVSIYNLSSWILKLDVVTSLQYISLKNTTIEAKGDFEATKIPKFTCPSLAG